MTLLNVNLTETTVRDRGRKGFPRKAGIVILIEVLDSAVTSTLKQTPPQIHKHLMSISRVTAHLPRCLLSYIAQDAAGCIVTGG